MNIKFSWRNRYYVSKYINTFIIVWCKKRYKEKYWVS